MVAITLSALAHSYLPQPRGAADFALKKTSHIWRDGQACALLGPSGCGKSTLLNIISGLLRPTAGRVLFDGCDVTMVPTEARNIAQVFQFPVVYETMSVRGNLGFALRNQGQARERIRARVNRIADMIGLAHLLEHKARTLGAAERQILSLGRALVREDVNAILLDEPLTVIDPQMKRQLRTRLKALHSEFGHTMIYVTHDQTEALTFADQVMVMHEGSVVQCGTAQELFETPQHTFVGYFIGSPGMNFLSAQIAGRRARVAGAAIDLGANYGTPKGRVQIGIRPHYVRLAKGGALPARILRVEDLGHQSLIRAEVEGTAVNLLQRAGEPVEADANSLVFDPAKISVFVDDWRLAPVSASAEGGG